MTTSFQVLTSSASNEFKRNKPYPIPDLSESDKARFWKKVSVRSSDECWEWLAYKPKGYGRFRMLGKKGIVLNANRIAYFLGTNVKPQPHEVVMHSCDNPSCCNPKHLTLGTQIQNIEDRAKKGRNNFYWNKHSGLTSGALINLCGCDRSVFYSNCRKKGLNPIAALKDLSGWTPVSIGKRFLWVEQEAAK